MIVTARLVPVRKTAGAKNCWIPKIAGSEKVKRFATSEAELS